MGPERSRGRALICAFVAAAAGAAAILAQETVIRVDVNLVRVIATVKDAAGNLVGSLDAGDFEITDNGVPQKISVFERRTQQPLSVALMIDTSGSTGKDLKSEIESIQKFLKAFFAEGNAEDRVAIFSFNYEVMKRSGFTRNRRGLEHSLRGLRGEAGTALYDAVYLASEELENREGRRVIVIVTDGSDTVSRKDFHASLKAAHLVDAVIYPIVIVPITNDAGRSTGGENALITMAERTGGRTFFPDLGAALDKAFVEILRDLRTQYFLGFYPKDVPPAKDPFHKLGIRVRRPGLQVLARTGYYGVSEASAVSPPGSLFSSEFQPVARRHARRGQQEKE
jgi:Ca-activated chloride channel family protein